MKKYNKPELEIVAICEVDVIQTSGNEVTDTPEKLITWGSMSRNVNSGEVDLFR